MSHNDRVVCISCWRHITCWGYPCPHRWMCVHTHTRFSHRVQHVCIQRPSFCQQQQQKTRYKDIHPSLPNQSTARNVAVTQPANELYLLLRLSNQSIIQTILFSPDYEGNIKFLLVLRLLLLWQKRVSICWKCDLCAILLHFELLRCILRSLCFLYFFVYFILHLRCSAYTFGLPSSAA